MDVSQHATAQTGRSPYRLRSLGYHDPATVAAPVSLLQVVPEFAVSEPALDAIRVSKAVLAAGGEATAMAPAGVLTAELTAAGGLFHAAPVQKTLPLSIWQHRRQLMNLAARAKPTVLHARNRSTAWIAKPVADALGLPFVTTFHGIYAYGSRLKKRYNDIMVSGDRVIAPSAFARRHILEHYPDTEDRITVVPRGIDVARYDPRWVTPSQVDAMRNQLQLIDGRPVLLHMGRLTFWRGVHILADAAKRMSDLNPYIILALRDGFKRDDRRDLEAYLEKLGLTEAVRFTETRHDAQTLYHMADAVLTPVIEPEIFPHSVAEAMAMGRPVIASNIGAAPELIDHHETGWLVPPADPVALEAAIREALSLTGQQRNNLSSWCRDHAAKHFDIKQMTDATLDVYLQLLEARAQVPVYR